LASIKKMSGSYQAAEKGVATPLANARGS